MRICNSCGEQSDGNFCPYCGAKMEEDAQKKCNEWLTCKKCSSTSIRKKEKKSGFPLLMAVVGAVATGLCGFRFFGVLGAVIGGIFGIPLGLSLPAQSEIVAICENCGNKFRVVVPTVIPHPLSVEPAESNLIITRDYEKKDVTAPIRVKIDNYAPFIMKPQMAHSFKVPEGFHQISYEQTVGFGRKKNRGQFFVLVQQNLNVTLSFKKEGIKYKY